MIGKAPEEQKESGSISQPQRLGLRAEGSHASGSRTYPTLLHGHCKAKANSSSAKAKLCLWPEHRCWEGVPPEGAVGKHPGRADMGSNLWRWQTAAQGRSPELKVAARPRSWELWPAKCSRCGWHFDGPAESSWQSQMPKVDSSGFPWD